MNKDILIEFILFESFSIFYKQIYSRQHDAFEFIFICIQCTHDQQLNLLSMYSKSLIQRLSLYAFMENFEHEWLKYILSLNNVVFIQFPSLYTRIYLIKRTSMHACSDLNVNNGLCLIHLCECDQKCCTKFIPIITGFEWWTFSRDTKLGKDKLFSENLF